MSLIKTCSLLISSLTNHRLLVVFIFLPVSLCGQGQVGSDPGMISLQEKLDSIIFDGIDSLAYPGAQLYVAVKGQPIIHKAYGFHTYDQNTPVALDHIYDLASITKVSSGLPLLMKFYMDGRINLDAPLKNYYPKFKKSNKGDLILREILSHQAGLSPYIVFWQNTLKDDRSFKRRTFSTKASRRFSIPITDQLYLHRKHKKKMIEAIKKSEVTVDPDYRYSGLFFLLLPDIIESIIDGDYYSYLRKNIYDPLGADKLMYNPFEQYPREKIIPTEQDTYFRKTLIHGYVHDEAAAMLDGVSCNAGLFSNAEDLAKLFQMYLNGGELNGRRYLVKEAIEEFTKYQYPDKYNRRGLGFDKPQLNYDPNTSYVAKDASPASFGHSGFTGTFVWADPEYDLLFIFLSNRVYPDRSQRELYTMNIRPKLHQAVYDYLNKE